MNVKKVKNSLPVEPEYEIMVGERLSPEEYEKSVRKMNEYRKRTQENMSEKVRLTLELMSLRFKIEGCIKDKEFNPQLNFGHFLRQYVDLLNRKRKVFASEIGINEAELSQFINNHRLPNESILVRLEIHSSNSLPAIIWFRLIQKEKEYILLTNKAIRREQKKNVSNKVNISTKLQLPAY
jgi:hypothetical protein